MNSIKYYGIYRGTVVLNEDPSNLGRINVVVPEISMIPGWANICIPFFKNSAKKFEIPEIGTHVWIQFEMGDVTYPIVIGRILQNKALSS